MIVNFKKIVVRTENITNGDDLVDLIMYSIGTYSIVNYVISENEITFYVEVPRTESDDEMEIEADIIIKPFDVINEYVAKYGKKYPDYNTFGEYKYMKSPDTFMKELVDYYVDNKIRIPLNEIEFVNGSAQIFKNDGTIIILIDEYVLSYDYYDFSDGTISIIKTNDINVTYANDHIDCDFSLNEFEKDIKEFDIEMAKLRQISDEYNYNEHQKSIKNMKDLISLCDGNASISTSGSINISAQEIEIQQMQTFIDSVKDDGQNRILSSTGAIELKSATYEEELGTVQDEEISSEELESFAKGYRNTAIITANEEIISIYTFNDMALKYNIIDWNIVTPDTISIKFIDGTTPESVIKKFNDMINEENTKYGTFQNLDHIKSLEESVKFLSQLRDAINDDTDIAQEFINKVNKHNIFVHETLGKIRSALLDMESDFNNVLKDEVNLNIDWESLTAHASKKERTVSTNTGVHYTSSPAEVNLIRVSSTDISQGDDEFYIPMHIITDEMREKYVFQDEALTIKDVPDFAFYQTKINGHFLLIEKTDL